MLARLRAWWSATRIDRELANGLDPHCRPELEYRAARLTRPESLVDLARGFERAIREAEAPPALTARVPVQRAAVRAAHAEIVDLSMALRMTRQPDPAAAAYAAVLLEDAESPLYVAGPPGALRAAIRRATERLEAA
jgi:hypothetical protein